MIQGQIVLIAHQVGGKFDKLQEILSRTNGGFLSSCQISDKDCVIKLHQKAVQLKQYVASDFKTNLNFLNGTNLAPIGIGHATWKPLNDSSIIPPEPKLSNEIKEMRQRIIYQWVRLHILSQRTNTLTNQTYYQNVYPNWNVTERITSAFRHINDKVVAAESNLGLMNNSKISQCYFNVSMCQEALDYADNSMDLHFPFEMNFFKYHY